MSGIRNVTETPRSFGERLYMMRLNKGMTQTEVGRPYTRAYISMLEGGKAQPSVAVLEHLAKRLKVTVPELFGGGPPGDISLGAVPTDALLEELQRRVRYPL